MATIETRKMVLAAAAVCDEKKAENTRVLELDPADSGFTDFFLITSGSNTRQTVAIADDIELKMKRDFGAYANSVEGRRAGEWILLDYVDFVVHIFVEEKRAFYDIERLRKSARAIDLVQLKSALKEKTAAARRIKGLPEEQSPASAPPKKRPAQRAAAAGPVAPKKSAARKTAAKKSATKKVPAKKSSTRVAAAARAKATPAKQGVATTERARSKKVGS